MSVESDLDGKVDALELSWRMRDGAGSGARPRLALADIVNAAIEIADAEGLDAVSMAAVAQRLGFSTMALYRHVPGKAELVELMFDVGVGVPDRDTVVSGDWRASMTSIARQLSAMYRRRRWLLEIPISAPPASPNNLHWFEAGLRALRETPLSVPERAAVLLVVVNLVRGNERLLAELESGRAELPTDRPYGEALLGLLPPGMYPETERALASGVFDDNSGDDDLTFGLERMLDGVEVLIARRSGA